MSRNPGLWTSRSAVMSSVGKTGGVGRSRARLTTRRTLHAALSSFPTRARGPMAAKWPLDPWSAMHVDDEHPVQPVPGSSTSLLAQREYARLQSSQLDDCVPPGAAPVASDSPPSSCPPRPCLIAHRSSCPMPLFSGGKLAAGQTAAQMPAAACSRRRFSSSSSSGQHRRAHRWAHRRLRRYRRAPRRRPQRRRHHRRRHQRHAQEHQRHRQHQRHWR